MELCPLENTVCSIADYDFEYDADFFSGPWGYNETDNEWNDKPYTGNSRSKLQEPSRSRFYSLFRRATANHGYADDYHSELRRFMGEKWTNSWMVSPIAMPGTFIVGLVAQILLKKIFGRLRMPERQHTRERLWNFAFYKFIFIFGVVNVESMDEMIIWVAWFILLGYIHFFIVLSRDRCEYLTFSPVAPTTSHSQIVALLGSIIGFSVGVLAFGCYLLWTGFAHIGLFTMAEGMLILMPSCHILLRYGYHNLRQGRSTAKWEQRTALYHNLNVVFEAGTLMVDLLHHVHMMCQICNLSASSLVVVAQIRFLCAEFVNKCRRHRNFLSIRRRLQQTYPPAAAAEIDQQGSTCSICWDTMEKARKLHCGHVFHESCLLSWLEQDISCPICRVSLTSAFTVTGRERAGGTNRLDAGGRFFHFQGSRINRWLPNVSVTVSHPLHEYTDNGSVEVMAEQVRQVFPNIAHHLIIQDLLETGSAESTIENILNGSFVLSQPVVQQGRTAVVADETPRTLTTLDIGGTLREIPDTPEACRALQIQRRETLVYEARKKFLAKLALEKASAVAVPNAAVVPYAPSEHSAGPVT